MVSDLVRDDVGPRKVAGRAEPGAQLLKKLRSR